MANEDGFIPNPQVNEDGFIPEPQANEDGFTPDPTLGLAAAMAPAVKPTLFAIGKGLEKSIIGTGVKAGISFFDKKLGSTLFPNLPQALFAPPEIAKPELSSESKQLLQEYKDFKPEGLGQHAVGVTAQLVADSFVFAKLGQIASKLFTFGTKVPKRGIEEVSETALKMIGKGKKTASLEEILTRTTPEIPKITTGSALLKTMETGTKGAFIFGGSSLLKHSAELKMEEEISNDKVKHLLREVGFDAALGFGLSAPFSAIHQFYGMGVEKLGKKLFKTDILARNAAPLSTAGKKPLKTESFAKSAEIMTDLIETAQTKARAQTAKYVKNSEVPISKSQEAAFEVEHTIVELHKLGKKFGIDIVGKAIEKVPWWIKIAPASTQLQLLSNKIGTQPASLLTSLMTADAQALNATAKALHELEPALKVLHDKGITLEHMQWVEARTIETVKKLNKNGEPVIEKVYSHTVIDPTAKRIENFSKDKIKRKIETLQTDLEKENITQKVYDKKVFALNTKLEALNKNPEYLFNRHELNPVIQYRLNLPEVKKAVTTVRKYFFDQGTRRLNELGKNESIEALREVFIPLQEMNPRYAFNKVNLTNLDITLPGGRTNGKFIPGIHRQDVGEVVTKYHKQLERKLGYSPLVSDILKQTALLYGLGAHDLATTFKNDILAVSGLSRAAQKADSFAALAMKDHKHLLRTLTEENILPRGFFEELVTVMRRAGYNTWVFNKPAMVFFKQPLQTEFVGVGELGREGLKYIQQARKELTSNLILKKEAEEAVNIMRPDRLELTEEVANQVINNKILRWIDKGISTVTAPGRWLFTKEDKNTIGRGYIAAKLQWQDLRAQGKTPEQIMSNILPADRLSVLNTLDKSGEEAAARLYGIIRTRRINYTYLFADRPEWFREGAYVRHIPFLTWPTNQWAAFLGDAAMGDAKMAADRMFIPLYFLSMIGILTGVKIPGALPIESPATLLTSQWIPMVSDPAETVLTQGFKGALNKVAGLTPIGTIQSIAKTNETKGEKAALLKALGVKELNTQQQMAREAAHVFFIEILKRYLHPNIFEKEKE